MPLEFIGPQLQRAAMERMTRRYANARGSGLHLWIVSVAYFVTVPLKEGAQLDHENMAYPPAVGCYICEQIYRQGMERQRCPGEPL